MIPRLDVELSACMNWPKFKHHNWKYIRRDRFDEVTIMSNFIDVDMAGLKTLGRETDNQSDLYYHLIVKDQSLQSFCFQFSFCGYR